MAFKRLIVFGLLSLFLSLILPARAQNSPTREIGTYIGDALTISPDGHWLVIATNAGTYLQDTTQLDQPPRELIGHQNMVWYASFSPDNSIVATASPDLTIRLWETTTGEPLDVISFPVPPIAPLFNADGRLLYIITGIQGPGPTYLFDRVSKQQIELEGVGPQIAFTPDGAVVFPYFPDDTQRFLIQHYVAEPDRVIRRDEPIAMLPDLSSQIGVWLSSNGAVLAIEDNDRHTIDFLDRLQGKIIAHLDYTLSVAEFTADNAHAIVRMSGGLAVVDLPQGTVTTYRLQPLLIYRIFGTWLLYGDDIQKVHLVDLTTGQDVTLQLNDTIFNNFVVSGQQVYIVSDVNLYRLDVTTGELLSTMPLSGFSKLMLSQGNHLVLISETKLTVIDATNNIMLADLDVSLSGLYRVRLGSDDKLYFVSVSNQVVQVNIGDHTLQQVLLPSLGADTVVYKPASYDDSSLEITPMNEPKP